MKEDTPATDSLSIEKFTSYTGLRLDIAVHVPSDASSILDIGCSTGTLLNYLTTRNPSLRTAGIEGDKSLFDIASSKLQSIRLADLNTEKPSQVFPQEKFDCIVFADVLEHLVSPESVLDDAFNMLTDEGTLIISTPNIRHVTAFWSIFVLGNFPRKDRGIFDKTHLRWFTKNELKRLFEGSDHEIVGIFSEHRIFDSPQSRVNRLLRRLIKSPIFIPIFSDFFGYQHIILAKKRK